jgi:hypothetical protein
MAIKYWATINIKFIIFTVSLSIIHFLYFSFLYITSGNKIIKSTITIINDVDYNFNFIIFFVCMYEFPIRNWRTKTETNYNLYQITMHSHVSTHYECSWQILILTIIKHLSQHIITLFSFSTFTFNKRVYLFTICSGKKRLFFVSKTHIIRCVSFFFGWWIYVDFIWKLTKISKNDPNKLSSWNIQTKWIIQKIV